VKKFNGFNDTMTSMITICIEETANDPTGELMKEATVGLKLLWTVQLGVDLYPFHYDFWNVFWILRTWIISINFVWKEAQRNGIV
jgi:hypothetical protein